MSRGKKWTPEELAVVKELYSTTQAKVLSKQIGRTPLAIFQKAYQLKVKKNVFTTRVFVGRSREAVSAIGASRVTAEGYILIKVGKNDWRLKQRIVWEKAHGAIPKGMYVCFKDNNTENCDIDNLHLVSSRDLLRKNSMHNLPEDLRSLIHMKGSLQLMINKRRKKDEQYADTEGSHISDDGRPSEGNDNSPCGELLSSPLAGTD